MTLEKAWETNLSSYKREMALKSVTCSINSSTHRQTAEAHKQTKGTHFSGDLVIILLAGVGSHENSTGLCFRFGYPPLVKQAVILSLVTFVYVMSRQRLCNVT